ncbi:hypothetical protein BJY04DRAFT_26848 [Aspergillus karnatakaensis]|uniref:uncharacterized protein n=1 Tax=Aspergillus karnatakaensis TaxID=1810916 RepID=UPI003CCCBBA3
MSIGLRSRVLDMALISLMTIRLSFTSDREQYLLFSLSTYNTGLQSFRRLLQGSASDSTPELVVISLIFTLFEASQQQPTRIYSSGWAGHLAGALTLLQRQGPARFQIDGYHAAFKKLREMTILFVLSKQECTFLAEPEWMEVPWDVINKTRRDYLLDIAMQITTIYALLHSDPSPDDYLGIQTQHRQLLDDLHSWRQSWLEAEAPGIHNPCQGCLNEPCLCLPAITKTVTNEFSFLAAEYTAIAILLNHITLHYLYDSATITDLELTSSALRIALLRTNLQSILTLPCFGHALSDTPGLTEGRCRALFPIWVLSETAPVFTPQRTLDWDWWDGLYDRANHGIA